MIYYRLGGTESVFRSANYFDCGELSLLRRSPRAVYPRPNKTPLRFGRTHSINFRGSSDGLKLRFLSGAVKRDWETCLHVWRNFCGDFTGDNSSTEESSSTASAFRRVILNHPPGRIAFLTPQLESLVNLVEQSSAVTSSRWKKWRNKRACPGQAYEPTDIEHVANIITHGISILPAVAALLHLMYWSQSTLHVVAGVFYGCSLIALFSMSTAFHCVCYLQFNGRVKLILHICDRATIFIFTACSYTPWLLLKEAHPYVFGVLMAMWLMVAGGICYQLVFHEQYKHFETFLYLFIGIVPGLVSIPAMADTTGLWRVAEGGAIYVIGIVFFKSDGLIPFAHAIWHVFVVIGAAWQYFAVSGHLYQGDGDIMNPVIT
ncbi:putative Monocyte to macrophage differentiation factor [Hypsibius exemplaris]|uniref:Monocyte to macrophage differentiation factor n=1 Tax=Hypsibius exemplaris TaxID=2072580 RepID=A0A1W0WG28_HYPEX|nr:putative Monocyte to macrophage differentiation factor [Hypsibius exemplaris]